MTLDTHGNLTIEGGSFGSTSDWIEVRVAVSWYRVDYVYETCLNPQLIVPHSMITCTSPFGYGSNRPLLLTVCETNSWTCRTGNGNFDFPAPVVFSATPTATDTSELSTIIGRNFGFPETPVSVEIAGNPCSGATKLNATTLTCRPPEGVSGPKTLLVTAGYSGDPGAQTVASTFSYSGINLTCPLFDSESK